MRRFALLAVALLALGAGPAHAVTKEYSTGNISARVADRLDTSIGVPDTGPVSFVRVSFRISAPASSAVAISLVSPRGTEVPLVVNRGAGANFGSGDKACDGLVTVFDSDMTTNPISAGKAPFTDDPYRPDGNLRSLYGENSRGKWILRIVNTGAPATLHCLTLGISRNIPQTLSARRGVVSASLTYVERSYFFEHLRVKIVRRDRTVLDAPIEKSGCRQCRDFRPSAVKVRDLDGGEPEVLLDLYSGGAHCCLVTLILRYDPEAKRYRPTLGFWGNYGSRLADLDQDGLPEFSAYDERFVYTFTAYVFSAAPIQIWRYRQGKLVDVTGEFPKQIEKSAVDLAKSFLKLPPEKDFDARSYVAAYVADQYLLGRPTEAKRALDFALAHGELYRGKTYLGLPAGRNFIAVLMKDLRRWGYIRPVKAGECSAPATQSLVRTFVRNYNRGRVTTIDRLWAPEPHFQWFSTIGPGARLGRHAYDRATLADYFRARVRLHERIRLISLAAGYDPRRNIVNFSGKLVRSADDIRPRPPKDFKGAADCESGAPSLIVWSM